jgi:hypothetical protein
MKTRALAPLFERAHIANALAEQQALAPTPLAEGEGGNGAAAHPFSLGE